MPASGCISPRNEARGKLTQRPMGREGFVSRFCHACGAQLGPAALFCSECATPVRQGQTETAVTPLVREQSDLRTGPMGKRKHWLPIAAVAAVCGAMGMVAAAQVFTVPAGPLATSKEARPHKNAATIHLPFDDAGFQAAMRAGLRHELTIDRLESLTYDGRRVTLEQLAVLIARNKHDRYLETKIRPAHDVRFDQVVKVIALFNRAGDLDFSIIGNEAFSENFGNRPSGRHEFEKIAFARNIGRGRDIPFWVSLGSRTGGICSIEMSGMPMNADDLRRNTNRSLDALLKRNWVEPTLRRREDIPRAVIQARPDTPWKCIGGALYNLQISGLPTMELIVSASPAPQNRDGQFAREMATAVRCAAGQGTLSECGAYEATTEAEAAADAAAAAVE